MISIIICSIDPQLLRNIKANIEATIGIDYEVISFDNREKAWGICKVYNHCAEKAKYQYLLFIHEDIIFHSYAWGKKLVNLLKKNKVGLVGVAGAVFKSSAPMSWVAVPSKYYRSSAFFEVDNMPPSSTSHSKVVTVDGMFLALKKDIWRNFPFSEELNGFHLYDIDLSYRIYKAKYDILVAGNIFVQHLSKGSFDNAWLIESIKWHNNKSLPNYVSSLSRSEINNLEVYGKISHLQYLLNNGLDSNKWFQFYFKLIRHHNRIYPKLFFKVVKKLGEKLVLSVRNRKKNVNRFLLDSILKLRVKDKNFAIISNNCWGGAIYKALNLPYNTPFVGLYINSPCYIKLLKNLDVYLKKELKFTKKSKYPIKDTSYPIGLLGDIEIHFLHYFSEEEARVKWDRRLKRLWDCERLFYKIDDRDFSSKEEILEFHKMPLLNTISFSKEKYSHDKNVKLTKPEDLILLHTTFHLFDLALFLNDGSVRNTFFNRVQNFLFRYPPTWN